MPMAKEPVNAGHAALSRARERGNAQGLVEVLPDMGFHPSQNFRPRLWSQGWLVLERDAYFLQQPFRRLPLFCFVGSLRIERFDEINNQRTQSAVPGSERSLQQMFSAQQVGITPILYASQTITVFVCDLVAHGIAMVMIRNDVKPAHQKRVGGVGGILDGMRPRQKKP